MIRQTPAGLDGPCGHIAICAHTRGRWQLAAWAGAPAPGAVSQRRMSDGRLPTCTLLRTYHPPRRTAVGAWPDARHWPTAGGREIGMWKIVCAWLPGIGPSRGRKPRSHRDAVGYPGTARQLIDGMTWGADRPQHPQATQHETAGSCSSAAAAPAAAEAVVVSTPGYAVDFCVSEAPIVHRHLGPPVVLSTPGLGRVGRGRRALPPQGSDTSQTSPNNPIHSLTRTPMPA